MSKFTTLVFVLAFAVLGAAFACSKLLYESNDPVTFAPIFVEGPQKHVVTAPMLAATARMTAVAAPAFRAQATDDCFYDIQEMANDRPVVLVFIKDGCPCSLAAQPYFNLLFGAYGKHARFFGVFDGSVSDAKKWAAKNQAAFPLLSDPDLSAVKEYKAENSAYVALIARAGTIEKLWPGYSGTMLADACARLARLTGHTAKPIDARDAPAEMATGCPY
jgi:peroxiredoxin